MARQVAVHRLDDDVPLAVAGTVHGRAVEVLVADLAEVLAHIGGWTEQDPGAVGCWGLRADYSGSLTLLLRRRAGAIAERLRTVHLVRLAPGEPHGATLAALCGERLTVLGVDVLPVGAGMPCDGCLVGSLVADRSETDRVVTARVDAPAVCWAAADI
ncbi:MAG TPA: hypothetical protein VGL06_29310 [Pseudonocardiaceae bacterium]